MKNSTLRLIWQATGALPPVGVPEAAAFLRQFNTVQTAWYIEHGKHATKDEAFGEIIKHREHYKPGTLGYAWMSRLNLFSDEVLPGWVMDFVNTNEGQISGRTLATGYRLILGSERYTLITDESVGLYQALTKPDQPKAKDLKSAKDFPGAIGYTSGNGEADGGKVRH